MPSGCWRPRRSMLDCSSARGKFCVRMPPTMCPRKRGSRSASWIRRRELPPRPGPRLRSPRSNRRPQFHRLRQFLNRRLHLPCPSPRRNRQSRRKNPRSRRNPGSPNRNPGWSESRRPRRRIQPRARPPARHSAIDRRANNGARSHCGSVRSEGRRRDRRGGKHQAGIPFQPPPTVPAGIQGQPRAGSRDAGGLDQRKRRCHLRQREPKLGIPAAGPGRARRREPLALSPGPGGWLRGLLPSRGPGAISPQRLS
jgi:hypothetical protein